MFQVRTAQLDAIRLTRFIAMAEQLIVDEWFKRRTFPEERARIPLRPMLAHAVAVAQRYGMESDRDLMVFVMHMIEINPAFHEEPHIHSILMDTSLSPEERRRRILTDVSEEAWDSAASRADADTYWAEHIQAKEPS
jgi:hypothetical protein